MKSLSFAGLVALCLTLCACQSLPEVPYDRQTAGNIKTIAIVTPYHPNDAQVVLATTVGQSFGLVGALIDAGMQASRDSDFEKIVHAANFSATDEFMARLSKGLEANGFTLTQAAVARPKMDFLKTYPPGTGADAYLDVVIGGYGYVAAGIGDSTPYRPYFGMQVRLVRATDSAILMQDTIIYNAYNIQGNSQGAHAVTISPDPQYLFADFSALKAHPDQAVRGLQEAADKPADAVAGLLR